MENYMLNFKQTLQRITDEDMKNAVFASFSSLKHLDEKSDPELFQRSVEHLRSNQLFRSCKASGINDSDIKSIVTSAVTKATAALSANLEKALDFACDPRYKITEKKEK